MNPFLHNRLFFARVRASAYERARLRFREARALFPENGSPRRDFLHALGALLTELETVHEYAFDAVRGLQRQRVARFRDDRRRGVLEEEIVLQYFCEEMETQARFLRMRVETDLRIRVYRERIRRIRKAKARDPDARAHLPGILDSLGGLAEAELGDFRRILDMMERRFEVGDRLMQVLRDKMTDEALAAEGEGEAAALPTAS
jgi:hypothetical protein